MMAFLLGKNLHLVGSLVHACSPECLGKLVHLFLSLFLQLLQSFLQYFQPPVDQRARKMSTGWKNSRMRRA